MTLFAAATVTIIFITQIYFLCKKYFFINEKDKPNADRFDPDQIYKRYLKV